LTEIAVKYQRGQRFSKIIYLNPFSHKSAEMGLQTNKSIQEAVGLPEGHVHQYAMMLGLPNPDITNCPSGKRRKFIGDRLEADMIARRDFVYNVNNVP